MNEKSLEELEAETAAQEATWMPLAHQAAAGNTPQWKDATETINTQASSIHGKGR